MLSSTSHYQVLRGCEEEKIENELLWDCLAELNIAAENMEYSDGRKAKPKSFRPNVSEFCVPSRCMKDDRTP